MTLKIDLARSKTKEDKEQQGLDTILGSQMGSDMTSLAHGQVDMRRFSNIPQLQTVIIPYFYQTHPLRGGGYARRFMEDYLNLCVSREGLGRVQVLRAIAGSKGTPMITAMKKPGWTARNITSRKWKQEAEQEGIEVVE